MDHKNQRIFLYARVSTEHQVERDSIDDQIDALRQWAKDHECIIIGEYVDAGFSAAKPYTTRPEFCRMLADADRLKPDLLIFTRLDRFTRHPRDYYNLAYTFKKHNLNWNAILQKIDTSRTLSASDEAVIGTMVVFSKFERDCTSERIIAHNIAKRARGELTSGKLPRGYMIQNKKPVKDPSTEPGISAFWRTYLSGQGLNASRIAADALGVHLSVSSASYLLRHAQNYSGTIQGIPCDPYLTEAEANQILSKRKKPIKATGRTYLFSGLIHCAECDRMFGAHINRTPNCVIIFYNCGKHYRDPISCPNKCNIYETDIESQLLNSYESALLALLNQSREAQKDPGSILQLRRRKSALVEKNKRLLDAYLNGVLDLSEFDEKKKEIEADIADLDSQIADCESFKKVPELRDILPENWKSIYSTLDREHQRTFWYSLLKEIRIDADRNVTFIPQY